MDRLETIFDGLTDQQREAVELSSGRHLVLAPPGTGKTELIARRVVYALKQGMPKERMFCGTFTIRAAVEMRERIMRYSGLEEDALPDIGNIHHFCYNFLFRQRRLPMTLQIMDEHFAKELILDCCTGLLRDIDDAEDALISDAQIPVLKREVEQLKEELHVKKGGRADFLRRFLPRVTAQVAYLTRCEAGVPSACRGKCEPSGMTLAREVARRYAAQKSRLFVMDFDDLLTKTYCLLDRGALKASEKYRWIQVDEVQDLNPLQWAIIEKLAAQDAVFVFFGDVEQSIFSFMGASLGALESKARECAVHCFRRNFRSTSYLLDLLTRYSMAVLGSRFAFIPQPHICEPAAGRLALESFDYDSVPREGGRGRDFAMTRENRMRARTEYVCQRLVSLLRRYPDETVAVLVQTNADANRIEAVLNGVAGLISFSGTEFTQMPDFVNAAALFDIAVNPFSRPGWARLFRLFAPDEVPDMITARRLSAELFECGLRPDDFLDRRAISDAPLPLERYARYAQEGRVVVFDTETTGLNPRNDVILQLSAAEYIHGELGQSLDLYLLTDRDIPPESEAVHHISKAVLAEKGIDPSEAVNRFLEFLGTDSLLVAHNLRFDRAMLINTCDRLGIVFDPERVPMCDSLRLARRLYPRLASYRLCDLLGTLHLEGNNSHNAMDDVWAAGNLFMHLAAFGLKQLEAQRAWQTENRAFLEVFGRRFSNYRQAFRDRLSAPSSFEDEINALRGAVAEAAGEVDADGGHDADGGGTDAETVTPMDRFFRWAGVHYAEDRRPFGEVLRDDWEDISRMKNADLPVGDEHIVVSTVHKAKGLQFDTVLIPDADEYPSFGAQRQGEAGRLESARLLYVAMSRAKKRLILARGCCYSEEGCSDDAVPFLDPVAECFDDDFTDIYVRAEAAGGDLSAEESSDWLAVRMRLADCQEAGRCPPDIDALVASPFRPLKTAALPLLQFMKDDGRRQALMERCLASNDTECRLLLLAQLREAKTSALLRSVRTMALQEASEDTVHRRVLWGVLGYYAELGPEAAAATTDLLTDRVGRVRYAAARLLLRFGNETWKELRGDDNDWRLLKSTLDDAAKKVIRWQLARLPSLSVAHRRNLEFLLT